MSPVLKPKPKQNVAAIVEHLCRTRAQQRQIPLGRRGIEVLRLRGRNFHVNRYEIRIDTGYAVTGNPVDMIDSVLNVVQEFDQRDQREQIERMVQVQSSILQWTTYLQRTMSPAGYDKFIRTLHLPEPTLSVSIAALAPDPPADGTSPFDSYAPALMAEAERMQDNGIYFRA